MVKIHFHVVPFFGLFWSVKYLNFAQKLRIWTAHHTFLERRHPEVTKNLYYVLSHKESKKVSAHGLIPVYRGIYMNYFKINPPIFYCLLFSENYLSPQVKINKTVNKHTVNYQPSPSQLISRVLPLIFPWTPKGFISPEYFLDFFLNLYIPKWLRKSFKFIVLRLLANTSVSQKIESINFYSCPKAKLSPRFLSLSPRQKEIAYSSRTAFSEDIMELKKLPKLTRVLITSFDK